MATGTIRFLDAGAWARCEPLVRSVIADLVRPFGLTATVDYQRGVPPVVNDAAANVVLADVVAAVLGEDAASASPQSLGGEDFGWYVEQVPGAMLRLGTRTPGGATHDLHQGDLRVDEVAIGIGARLLAGAAVAALGPS